MADDLLSAATEALRELPVDGGGAATRLRVRRSLEARHRSRRRVVGVLTGAGVLLAGTMSWAFATGRVEAVWRAIVEPAAVYEPAPAAPILPPVAPEPAPAPRVLAAPEPAPAPPEPTSAPPIPPPAAPAAAPAPARIEAPAPRPEAPARRAAPVRPVEALYQRAHELHFRGTDYPAAIAAWEAYLAAEPTGRFVAEARYNRALLLIRVGRYAEARTELAPYARGELAGGYRRDEATRLLERLPERDR